MTKHEPFEHDAYERGLDTLLFYGVIVSLIISVVLIAWEPDVEAIGTWVFNLIK